MTLGLSSFLPELLLLNGESVTGIFGVNSSAKGRPRGFDLARNPDMPSNVAHFPTRSEQSPFSPFPELQD